MGDLERNAFLDTIDPSLRLQTELFGNKFESPLIVASGTLVERFDQIQPYVDAGAGLVIPRSTRLVMSRTVHPSPHLFQIGTGSRTTMLNAEWTGADISYWREYIPEIRSINSKVALSVSGRDIDGCVQVCRELDECGVPFFEVNVSCGVSNGVHGYITRDPDHIAELCTKLKDADLRTPFGIKLGHSDGIVDLAVLAQNNGADLIISNNTYGPVFDFDIDTKGNPNRVVGVQGAKGGLSGEAVFHITLTDVADLASELKIPVIASGGVTSPLRALKMMYAGARMVQVYSLLHDKATEGPETLKKLTTGLLKEMDKHGVVDIRDVVGRALGLLDLRTDLDPKVPTVNVDKCTGCDKCVEVCLPGSIHEVESDNRRLHAVTIDAISCIGCGHCVSVCPVPDVLKI